MASITIAQPAATNGTGEGTAAEKGTVAETATTEDDKQAVAKGMKRKKFVVKMKPTVVLWEVLVNIFGLIYLQEEHYNVTEDEPDIPDSFVCLDWFNSDLSLKIDKVCQS
jgi:hypothetical protein